MRRVRDQVVVITGASSGIGRKAAELFGRQGAIVVLAARDEAALRDAAAEVEDAGGRALVVPTDVARWEEVVALADRAVEAYERIDTWVNDAAASAFGRVVDLGVDEIEQVLRSTLLGQIHGMKAALRAMRPRGEGVIINVSSIAGERAVPLQAPYCAAKHGIKGFTEALRLELAHEGSGVRVVHVMPASINTPFFDHARVHAEGAPRPVPPVYDVELAARAIVEQAERPARDVYVGGMARTMSLLQRLSPSLVDWYMLSGGRAFKEQLEGVAPYARADSLFAPAPGTDVTEGRFHGEVKRGLVFSRATAEKAAAKALALAATTASVATFAALEWGGKGLREIRRRTRELRGT